MHIADKQWQAHIERAYKQTFKRAIMLHVYARTDYAMELCKSDFVPQFSFRHLTWLCLYWGYHSSLESERTPRWDTNGETCGRVSAMVRLHGVGNWTHWGSSVCVCPRDSSLVYWYSLYQTWMLCWHAEPRSVLAGCGLELIACNSDVNLCQAGSRHTHTHRDRHTDRHTEECNKNDTLFLMLQE